MNLDKRLIRLAMVAGGSLAVAILAGFISGLLVILQAGQITRIIEAVFLKDSQLAGVMSAMGWLAGVMVLRSILVVAGESAAGCVAARVKAHLRQNVLRRLFELGPGFSAGENSGDLTARLVQGVDSLDAYFSQYLPQVCLAGLVPLAILVVVFPLDGLSGFILLVTAPLIPLFMILIGRTTEAKTSRQWETLRRLSGYFLDTLQGLTELKQLGRSLERAETIDTASRRYATATLDVLRIAFLSALVLELAGTLSTALISVQIGLRLLYGQMEFRQAFFILLLAPEFYLPLRQLGIRFHAGTTGVAAAHSLFSILDHPSPQDSNGMGEKNHGAPILPVGMDLRRDFVVGFKQVSYQYPENTGSALADVSFQIMRGQKVALVGKSGAGKSTLASLLLRFVEPLEGDILVNGVSIQVLPPAVWRSQIAWVPQHPRIFAGTLAENICLAKPDADAAAIQSAVQAACLDKLIEQLPSGIDTPVGEAGAKLSRGQAQRLALARAYLKDAPFLILDEPTSQVDLSLEQDLEAASRRVITGRTTLLIAHRLQTVINADLILVLENGRIVESGSHPALLKRQGAYARLLDEATGIL